MFVLTREIRGCQVTDEEVAYRLGAIAHEIVPSEQRAERVEVQHDATVCRQLVPVTPDVGCAADGQLLFGAEADQANRPASGQSRERGSE